jgi:hypothetical protein
MIIFKVFLAAFLGERGRHVKPGLQQDAQQAFQQSWAA